ncbi:STAS domain-containing protein [Bizionia myxarmorum]|nr:STAS domain-containing protein [Bizionia myxarmorum]
MSLIISHYNNFFKVKGILDKKSVSMFQNEFEHVFDNLQSVTISIEELDSIDKFGVMALAKLHNESLQKKKQLSIVGFGCKDLYDHFKTNDAA